jgi:hypothetical protein
MEVDGEPIPEVEGAADEDGESEKKKKKKKKRDTIESAGIEVA